MLPTLKVRLKYETEREMETVTENVGKRDRIKGKR